MCFLQDLVTENTENTCYETGGMSVLIHMVLIVIALCATTTLCERSWNWSRGVNRLNRNSFLSEVKLDTGESTSSFQRISTSTKPNQDSYTAAQEDHGCLCVSLPFSLSPSLSVPFPFATLTLDMDLPMSGPKILVIQIAGQGNMEFGRKEEKRNGGLMGHRERGRGCESESHVHDGCLLLKIT